MLKLRFGESTLPVVDVVASQYISGMYDHYPWIGVAPEVDQETHNVLLKFLLIYTAQKMKFPIKNLFRKCDQICSFLRIWSHLLKNFLIKNFIFCAVII